MVIWHWYWHLVLKNGNFTLLLTSSGHEWQFDMPLTSSGQEWQFDIATDIYCSRIAITLLLTSSTEEWQFHIAIDIYWSRMTIWHCYWHLQVQNGNFTLLLTYLVVKNGNFTLLLTSSCLEWQFWHCFWQLVVKNGNFATDIPASDIYWQWWTRMAISHCYSNIKNVSHCYWHLVVYGISHTDI